MTYARREVWRSWAVKFGGSVGPQLAPTPTYDQGQFYRSTVPLVQETCATRRYGPEFPQDTRVGRFSGFAESSREQRRWDYF